MSIGDKPTQLQVTIDSNDQERLRVLVRCRQPTIERSATADFNGPALMGSPCNTFGNEPPGTGSTDQHGPATPTSQIVAPRRGPVHRNPQMWGAIAGPDTPKDNGDEFMTRTCNTGNAGCTGTTNDEFDPQGYFYIVRVAPRRWAPRSRCRSTTRRGSRTVTSAMSGRHGTMKNDMNNYTPDGLPLPEDGLGRVAQQVLHRRRQQRHRHVSGVTTSYDLRNPTDTYNPKITTPVTGASVSTSRTTPPVRHQDRQLLRRHQHDPRQHQAATYNDNLAKVYHQWVKLCTFTPPKAGDYYLQIRTNVAAGRDVRR